MSTLTEEIDIGTKKRGRGKPKHPEYMLEGMDSRRAIPTKKYIFGQYFNVIKDHSELIWEYFSDHYDKANADLMLKELKHHIS